jgi:methylenetetrahydrofolate dehydrogenase (NADP+)/methenyltetrahydrofolate cyclohydrolase
MSATELGGRELAAALQQELISAVSALGFTPRLDVFAPEGDDASAHYGRMIVRLAAKIGVSVKLVAFHPADGVDSLREQLRRSASDGAYGIQVHKPLPSHGTLSELLEPVAGLDVEGVSPAHVGRLLAQRASFVPCTALAVWRLLAWHEVPLDGTGALVLGRSDIVGSPLAALLQHSGATVTVAHRRTKDLAHLVAQAELIVSAAGQRDLVAPEWIRTGAVLADVGHHVLEDGSVRGDFSSAHHVRSRAFTPVPGGVGPVTTYCLLEAVVRAAAIQSGRACSVRDPLRRLRP